MRPIPLLLSGAAALGGALGVFAQSNPAVKPPSNLGGITFGSVTRIDYAARKITLAPVRKADGEQTIEVPADAALVRIESASASQLRVGDRISVTGLPLVLDARQVRIGDERPQPQGARRRPAPAPAPPPARRAPRGNRPAPAPPPPPGSTAQFYGQVIRVNPLVLSFQPGGPTFEVRTSRRTRFTRLVKLTFAQIKARDPIMVHGRRLPSGVLQARRVQVGLEGLPFTRAR